jgi:hypothetical protein
LVWTCCTPFPRESPDFSQRVWCISWGIKTSNFGFWQKACMMVSLACLWTHNSN